MRAGSSRCGPARKGYRHRPVMDLAVRDDEPLVQPWPED